MESTELPNVYKSVEGFKNIFTQDNKINLLDLTQGSIVDTMKISS